VEAAFPPVNTSVPQLTLRAVLTGMVLGALLSLCNIYSGLKIGWTVNMSITATLLSYGFWKVFETTAGTNPFGPIENNMNQTAASAAASVSSAGLVAPVPALAMITGQTLGWPLLAAWTFSVMLVGVMVAIAMRQQMLVQDKLPFPFGVATAQTIKEMYERGAEAMARVYTLLAAALAAGILKLTVELVKIPKLMIPGTWSAVPGGVLAQKGITTITTKNLTFALDPAVLMVGIGMLIGVRACVSIIIGGVVAWAVIAPQVLELGWAEPGKVSETAMWFGSINKWMLWPGVSMMVTASLTSFAFSWKSVLKGLGGLRKGGAAHAEDPHAVPKKWFVRGLIVALVLSVVCQVMFFDIAAWVAVFGVLTTFVLAVVAARVSGETGITPVGPMGKVTQLMFGVISPGSATTNLMAANVTGGSASQAGDLLHDMKTGLMLGAAPKAQALAQLFGIMAGSTVGAAAYLLLVPDPSSMLLTEEWPAPAVAAWKAVAELFMLGIEAMPEGAPMAMAWGGGVGVVLSVLEKVLPKHLVKWVPSGNGIGIAFVVPALYSVSMFIGGLIQWLWEKFGKSLAERFSVALASGMIAGESLVGVGIAIWKVVK